MSTSYAIKTRLNRYKLIRMMFYMGVDDLFFADELDFRFENYIKKLSN